MAEKEHAMMHTMNKSNSIIIRKAVRVKFNATTIKKKYSQLSQIIIKETKKQVT